MGYYLEGDGYQVDGVQFRVWVPGEPLTQEPKKEEPKKEESKQEEGNQN